MLRAFTLLEMMIVVAVIGVGGALAMVSMADQVAQARARSEAVSMLQRLKSEHRQAHERMRSLKIEIGGDGAEVHYVVRGGDNCTGDLIASSAIHYDFARLRSNTSALCFTKNGELHTSSTGMSAGNSTAGFSTPDESATVAPSLHIETSAANMTQLTRIRIDQTGINDDGHTTMMRDSAAPLTNSEVNEAFEELGNNEDLNPDVNPLPAG